MDKLIQYSNQIREILSKHVNLCNQYSKHDLENILVIDENNRHYIWMSVGWRKSDRINDITVYVRIRDQKFWIEEDWTEVGIANELMALGVPKEDIVLGFHSPQMRPYTDFAVA